MTTLLKKNSSTKVDKNVRKDITTLLKQISATNFTTLDNTIKKDIEKEYEKLPFNSNELKKILKNDVVNIATHIIQFNEKSIFKLIVVEQKSLKGGARNIVPYRRGSLRRRNNNSYREPGGSYFKLILMVLTWVLAAIFIVYFYNKIQLLMDNLQISVTLGNLIRGTEGLTEEVRRRVTEEVELAIIQRRETFSDQGEGSLISDALSFGGSMLTNIITFGAQAQNDITLFMNDYQRTLSERMDHAIYDVRTLVNYLMIFRVLSGIVLFGAVPIYNYTRLLLNDRNLREINNRRNALEGPQMERLTGPIIEELNSDIEGLGRKRTKNKNRSSRRTKNRSRRR